MKKSKPISIFSVTTLLSLSLIFTSCNKENAKAATNSLSKAVNNCSTYNTENQGDAENRVVQSGNDYKFNLYWLGSASKVSVWENNGVSDYYEVKFAPLMIYVLGENGQATSSLVCAQDKDSASECIERFETILTMTKEARQSQAALNVKLSSGKEMTFKCTDEFANKKIAELKAFRTAARN